MSNAKKCNRCKTCFDPLEMKGQMVSFSNPNFRTSEDIQHHYYGELFDKRGGLETPVDLCPDCTRKFKLFMNPDLNEVSEAFDRYPNLDDKCVVNVVMGKRLKTEPDSDPDGDDMNPVGDIIGDFSGTNFSNPNMK